MNKGVKIDRIVDIERADDARCTDRKAVHLVVFVAGRQDRGVRRGRRTYDVGIGEHAERACVYRQGRGARIVDGQAGVDDDCGGVVSAVERVVAGTAVQVVIAGIAVEDIIGGIAGAGNIAAAGQDQVFDLEAGQTVGEGRDDGVDSTARGFDHRVADTDIVDVIAAAAGKDVVAIIA